MKIFNIIEKLSGGGAEKVVADLSYFLSVDFDHTIINFTKGTNNYPNAGNLILEEISGNFITKNYKKIKYLLNFKKHNPNDIFISHLWVANILNCLTSNKQKTVIVMHGRWSITPDKGKILDFLTKKIYNRADKVVCVSQYMKDLYKQLHGDQKKIEVIYNGVKIEQIKSLANLPIKDFVLPNLFLVYVAGLRPVKNHLNLLTNLQEFLTKSEYHLVLVGDGEMRKEIEHKITELGLKDKVILLGNLKNPHNVVNRAKYAILASEDESFSLTVVEALALGVPIISTDCGGPREILLSQNFYEELNYPYYSNGGFLIDTNLNHSIGNIIKNVNQNSYKNMKIDARKTALKFSIDETTNAYKKLILSFYE